MDSLDSTWLDVEKGVYLQNMEQSSFEFVDSFEHVANVGVEGLWGALKVGVVEVENVVDGIHQKTDIAALGGNDDVHGFFCWWKVWQAQTSTEVDGGNNLSSEIDEARDLCCGQRHRSHFPVA